VVRNEEAAAHGNSCYNLMLITAGIFGLSQYQIKSNQIKFISQHKRTVNNKLI